MELRNVGRTISAADEADRRLHQFNKKALISFRLQAATHQHVQVLLLLVVKLLQKQGFGVKTWQAGMRVEALDRKTPTLICVATVGMQTNVVE